MAADFDLDAILAKLRSNDKEERGKGEEELSKLRDQDKPLTREQGLKMLHAAAERWPTIPNEDHDFSSNLVEIAAKHPRPEWIPEIVRLFDKFSDTGKGSALGILADLKEREAAEAYMAIVRAHAKAGQIPGLVTASLNEEPRHADVFFPELLQYASVPQISHDVYRLYLGYCKAGLVQTEAVARSTPQLVEAYQPLADQLRPAQQATGVAWMWEDDYRDRRARAALLLDLFGYCPPAFVESKLREALNFADAILKYFAIVSLLRLGKTVSAEDISAVAARAETRNWLYQFLQNQKQEGLFPKKFLTQAAFAESDMVNWLVYPTELGRVPDEIELMKVVPIDTGLAGGIYDYYLFRFRTLEPHWAAKNGWIAGVSGPFHRQASPTVHALGHTFSTFTKWEAMHPDDHVGDISELKKSWREYHLRHPN